MKPQKQNTRRIRAVVCIATAAAFIVAAVYLLFFYNKDAYERQSIEESIADDFIADLIKLAEGGREGDEKDEEGQIEGSLRAVEDESTVYSPPVWRDDRSAYATHKREILSGDYEEDAPQVPDSQETTQQKTYDDPDYYQRNGVTYTPDYAVGYLFCVLEYPKAGIRRGVYSGDWADIYYDLDLWMATSARPDYELGKTHMAIYGHNHTAQDLSFNNLKVASLGDEFILYSTSGLYVYEVTRIFADWRSSVSKNCVDDMTISQDVCYIITCGRDNFLVDGKSSRYKDFVVEGHLKEKLSLTEYARQIYGEEEEWRE